MESPAVPARTSAFESWLCHSLIAVALGLWFGTIVLLFVRVLVYADLRPLSGPVLLTAGLVISVVALLTRWVWPVRATRFGPAHALRFALPLTALIVTGLLLCQQVTDVPTLVGFWLIVGLSELATLACLATWRYDRWQQRRPATDESVVIADAQMGDPVTATDAAVPSAAADADEPPGSATNLLEPEHGVPQFEPGSGLPAEPEGARVTQQLTRCEAPNGGETIAGRVRVDFAAGERLSAAHLSFTPPLHSVPEVFVDQLDGPPASVAVGTVYAHGARVDVRLDEPAAAATSVWCELYVVAPGNGRRLETN